MTEPFVVPYPGMRVDQIAKRLLQTEKLGATEAVLAANPRLSSLVIDGLVPEGTAVHPPRSWAPAVKDDTVLPWE